MLRTLRKEHDDIMAQLGGLLTEEGEEPLSEAKQLQLGDHLKEIETEIAELEGKKPPAKTETCGVCFEKITSGQKDTTTTSCGHLFHTSCLAGWLQQRQMSNAVDPTK